MIVSFRDSETAKIWNGERSRRLPLDIQATALRKLRHLDAVLAVDELHHPPGNQLEALRADRAGQHSIRINRQWRICFRWTARGAEDVEIVDYH